MSEARILMAVCKCGARLQVKTRQSEKSVGCPKCNSVVKVSEEDDFNLRVEAEAEVSDTELEHRKRREQSEREDRAFTTRILLGIAILIVGVIASAFIFEIVAKILASILLVVFVGCVWHSIWVSSHVIFGRGESSWSELRIRFLLAVVTGTVSFGLAVGILLANDLMTKPW